MRRIFSYGAITLCSELRGLLVYQSYHLSSQNHLFKKNIIVLQKKFGQMRQMGVEGDWAKNSSLNIPLVAPEGTEAYETG
jgi:hypothetical protein